MLTCEICGRKFKTRAALGGHMSNAHPKQKVLPAAVQGQPAEQAVLLQKTPEEITQEPQAAEANGQVMVPRKRVVEQEPQPVKDEESIAEEIRGKLKRGYDFEQLTKVFGFKEKTVRQEVERMIPPAGNEVSKAGDGLPVTRRIGGGAEVTTPEAVLRSYMDGSVEEEIELRGMMKLRAAMLMVMDLVNIQKEAAEADARRLKPILDLMQETREEQDAAAERAKGSSTQIAQEAAHQTALEMASFIEARIPKGEPPKDSGQMFTKMMDRMWEMMEHTTQQKMMPGYQQGKVPAGWQHEKEGE